MNRTAMDGSYTIPNVSEGDYGVLALLPGYLSPLDQLSPEDFQDASVTASLLKLLGQEGTVHVVAHQTASHDVTLVRGASISGQVLYSDGTPASQVNLEVEDINAKPHKAKPGEPDVNFAAMMRSMFTHQTNGTNDEGRFRISGIAPGTYRIAAISASMLGLDDSAMNEGAAMFSGMLTDRNALHVYSGNTLHKNAAKTYELRAGDNITGVDITIPLSMFHQIRGVLAAQDGRTINAAQLMLTDTTDDSFHFSASPSDDGSFTFATVPAGTYKLAASQARIMALYPNTMPDIPVRWAPKHPVNAFADADTTLIVKDSDLLDVSLLLTEMPLPKEESSGSPSQSQQ
jgi:hypothetical protein